MIVARLPCNDRLCASTEDTLLGLLALALVVSGRAPSVEAAMASDLLGLVIKGFPVHVLLVEENIPHIAEVFVGMTYDSAARTAVLLASRSGGTDVEAGDRLLRRPVSAFTAGADDAGREVAAVLGFDGQAFLNLSAAVARLRQSFAQWDALLLEINPLVLEASGQVIYYVGPAPARPGEVIGPAGPTTAGRVDLYTPQLLALGLKGMIGKGKRSVEVRRAIAEHGAVYFAMVGGAAALVAEHIKQMDLIAYADLGTEAIYQLVVEDLRMVVANDVVGGDLFEAGRARYRQEPTT